MKSFEDSVSAWEAVGPGSQLDLIIADVVFPAGRTNGLSLVRYARQNHPRLPAIFMTGYKDVAELVTSEAHMLLMKPFELPELVEAAARILTCTPAGPPHQTSRQ